MILYVLQYKFFWCRFESSREAVAAWNLANRWRKRGIAMLPVKFGIAFTSK
jgi:xanthine dehydrogenase/oxidase